MTLLELLVKELHKRGGWPECAVAVTQDNDGAVCAWVFHDPSHNGYGWLHRSGRGLCRYWRGIDGLPLADDSSKSIVTRDQYEAALAASQKPVWSGEGLPPVGCECEWRDTNIGWLPVTIKYISEQIVVMASPTNLSGVQELTEIAKDIICDKPQFRPLRTEADKKRDAAVEAIDYWMPEFIEDTPNQFYHAKKLYDAIAAGKIPGVKLED